MTPRPKHLNHHQIHLLPPPFLTRRYPPPLSKNPKIIITIIYTSSGYRLIGIYSKPTDKLAAVAGIAQQVQLRTGDTYLAGLWKSNIRRGLEWWSNPPSILVRPSTPQAPSWRWAALNPPSSSSSSNYDPSATLVGAFNPSGTAHTPLDDQEHGVQLVAFDPHLTDYGCLGNSSGSITLLGL